MQADLRSTKATHGNPFFPWIGKVPENQRLTRLAVLSVSLRLVVPIALRLFLSSGSTREDVRQYIYLSRIYDFLGFMRSECFGCELTSIRLIASCNP